MRTRTVRCWPLALAQAARLRDFIVLPDDLSFEPFALMLPRNEAAFRLAVNAGIAQVFRSGDVIELYNDSRDPPKAH